jgi:hypothetical protein
VSGGVLLVEFSNPLQEFLSPTLLEQTHQRRTQSLAGIRRHLGNGRLGTLALLHIAARNLLELEISCHIGGDQDVCQLAVGHEELGDQVDVPVVDSSVLLPGFLASGDVAVLLEELQKRSADGTYNISS